MSDTSHGRWTQVLDEITDIETVQAILDCQREDLQLLADSSSADDFSLARTLYNDELQREQAILRVQAEFSDDEENGTNHTDRDLMPEVATASVGRDIDHAASLGAHENDKLCDICFDRVPVDECSQVCEEHNYCATCLQGLFQVALTDRSAYPPRCCGSIFSFTDIQHLLGPAAETFARKMPELEDSAPVYCHDGTCTAYIAMEQRTLELVGTCSACDKKDLSQVQDGLPRSTRMSSR